MKKQLIYILVGLSIHMTSFAQISGTLNKEFNYNGWSSAVLGSQNALYINKTIVQEDGKILVCARAYLLNQEQQAVIARYNADGSLDRTFGGGDGVVKSKEDVRINANTSADGMALQSNGKIIIVGNFNSKTERILRLNTDGSLDRSFGNLGFLDSNVAVSATAQHVSVQSDNKIIVSGKRRQLVNGNLESFVFLQRYTENGGIDRSFGNSGSVVYNPINWTENVDIFLSVNDLIILSDNSILVNQTFTVMGRSAVMLRKFNANGALDVSFGTRGDVVKSEFSKDGGYQYSTSAVQENGSILTSFTSQEANSRYTASVFRINDKGELDSLFVIKMAKPTAIPDLLQIITSDEYIYLVKKTNPEDLSFDEIHCYDLKGELVNTFGVDGIAILNHENTLKSFDVYAAIAADGTVFLTSDISIPNKGQHILISSLNGTKVNQSKKNDFPESRFSFFPNPTTGLVNISNSENFLIDTIEITDVLGNTILIAKGSLSKIDLSSFTSGVYIFTIHSGESIMQKKIIKQ